MPPGMKEALGPTMDYGVWTNSKVNRKHPIVNDSSIKAGY